MTSARLAAVLATSIATGAVAQSIVRAPGASEAIDVVLHVDVLPDHIATTRAAIASFVEAARREPGAQRIDAMQEVRQNHFDIVESWRDEVAYRAHQASSANLQLGRSIGPWLASPIDERLGTPLH